MVTSCLVKDPTKRPTAQKLLKHSFFKGEKHPEITVKKLLAGLVDRIQVYSYLTGHISTYSSNFCALIFFSNYFQDDDDSQLSLRRMASIELEALSKVFYSVFT